MPREELWAKSDGPYPLPWHLLDAAAAMEPLWRLWLRPGLKQLLIDELGEDASTILSYLAGVHDIGKANPVFQLQLASDRDFPLREHLLPQLKEAGYSVHVPKLISGHPAFRRHEQVSAQHLATGSLTNASAAEQWVAMSALGHHGKFNVDTTNVRSTRKWFGGKWSEAREELRRMIEDATGAHTLPDSISPVAVVLISGLVILADRLASQQIAIDAALEAQQQGHLDPADGCAWIAARREFFEQRVRDTLGVPQLISDPPKDILRGRKPRETQAQAADVGRGLWLLMTPTGSGKTEAAMLRHAAETEALTLLLPTQATTTAAMRRYEGFFANTDSVAALAHGMASLDPFYQDSQVPGRVGLFPTDFVSRGGNRLLAPVTVATVDQALMASLPLKWSHLRLLALANSHVVLDEAHTLDQYQLQLALPLLSWLGATGTRVTVLTATLSAEVRDQIVQAYAGQTPGVPAEFPSTLTATPDAVAQRSQNAEPYRIDLQLVESADSVSEHVKWVNNQPTTARLGVFVNTIDRAIAVARQLEGREVVVLHSRMSAAHRQQIGQYLENKLGPGAESRGLVVVGTQAIEASLDIDLDAASTDLAPAASLIQRAGRVWRRPDPQRQSRLPGVSNLPLQIVCEDSDVAHYPYFQSELDRTWKFLVARTHLDAPADLQPFVEAGHFSWDDAEDALEELAATSLAGQKGRYLAQGIRALASPQAGVDDFGHLTHSEQIVEGDDTEHPRTRLSDYESVRVLVTNSVDVPGGWHTDAAPVGIEQTRAALASVITVTGSKRIAALKQTMQPLPDAPAVLAGVLVGPLPPDFRYDPALGLVDAL